MTDVEWWAVAGPVTIIVKRLVADRYDIRMHVLGFNEPLSCDYVYGYKNKAVHEAEKLRDTFAAATADPTLLQRAQALLDQAARSLAAPLQAGDRIKRPGSPQVLVVDDVYGGRVELTDGSWVSTDEIGPDATYRKVELGAPKPGDKYLDVCQNEVLIVDRVDHMACKMWFTKGTWLPVGRFEAEPHNYTKVTD